jgi:hypothetical protein
MVCGEFVERLWKGIEKAISFAKTLLGFALNAPHRAQKLCSIEAIGHGPLLLRQEILI